MVNKRYKKYAQSVVAQINCSQKEKARIKEDIIEMLNEKTTGDLEGDPEELMGEVEEVAAEFRENLSSTVHEEHPMEYKSDIKIMGLPLYHIILQNQLGRNNRSNRLLTAKGIFAVGPCAIGVVSIGGVSFGLISIGGVAVGLLSFAGLALGLLSAFGGVAIAYEFALGGVAIASNLAIGAVAISREVAIGATTYGKLMLYEQEYIQPGYLDDGAFKAFRSEYKADFLREFDTIYERFSGIKKFLVHTFIG